MVEFNGEGRISRECRESGEISLEYRERGEISLEYRGGGQGGGVLPPWRIRGTDSGGGPFARGMIFFLIFF